jgi:tripartite ATP-independent transporter DctM subunit
LPVAGLILAVLGSIYGGIATATEAAALGVTGALLLALAQRTLTLKGFVDSLNSATLISCMIAMILAAAAFLTVATGFIGLPELLAKWVGGLQLSRAELLLSLTVLYVVLGCFLDGISMIALTASTVLPAVAAVGIDPLWFGIFIVLLVEMSLVTPPVGLNLFVLQGLSQRDLGYVSRATLPFFGLLLVAVLLISIFPSIVTALPDAMLVKR